MNVGGSPGGGSNLTGSTGGGGGGGGGDGGVGAAIGGVADLISTDQTNKANARMMREQMAFQRVMSGTAHQREVKDLIRAGLNPLLSATGGASTPPGAMAEMENPVSQGISSALQIKELALSAQRQKQEISNMKSSEKLNEAEERNKDADTHLKNRGAIKAEIENEALKTFVKPFISSTKQGMSSVKKLEQQSEDILESSRKKWKQQEIQLNNK